MSDATQQQKETNHETIDTPDWLGGALVRGAAQAQTLVSNLVVGLDPVHTMAFLTVANNPPSEFAVTLGSNMVFRLDDPLCTGACTGDLNFLRVTLAPFSQDLVISGGPGGTAHVNFDSPTLMIVGPVPLQTDGLQFIVPVGTTVSFTATISGTATIGSDTVAIPRSWRATSWPPPARCSSGSMSGAN